MKKEWNYVEKDGNPTKPGMYWVTLIYPEWGEDGLLTGRQLAYVDSRYFADLEKEPELKGWAMDDQPQEGLAWTDEVGSHMDEQVYAWMPIEEVGIANLPEGVVAT